METKPLVPFGYCGLECLLKILIQRMIGKANLIKTSMGYGQLPDCAVDRNAKAGFKALESSMGQEGTSRCKLQQSGSLRLSHIFHGRPEPGDNFCAVKLIAGCDHVMVLHVLHRDCTLAAH